MKRILIEAFLYKEISKYFKIFLLMILLSAIPGCTVDLSVENQNNPDRKKIFNDPSFVEEHLSKAFKEFYWLQSTYSGIGTILSTIADELSSSWGGVIGLFESSEPRKAWDNSPSYRNSWALEYTWKDLYESITTANDVLIAIDDGMRFFYIDDATSDTTENTERNTAWSRFIQGICYGTLGLIFDKCFIVDEKTDLERWKNIPPSSYKKVIDFAVEKLNQCIKICEENSFTIPDSWAPQGSHSPIDENKLIRLCHSYIARFKACEARSVEERNSADWASIKNHAEKGIVENFGVENDGKNWLVDWGLQLMAANPDWARIDYRLIGPADTSGAYEAWLATDVQSRNMFDVKSYDRRVHPAGDIYADGKYFFYSKECWFRASRGTYHFSHYNCLKTKDIHDTGTGWVTIFGKPESDLILAEAELRLGNAQAAADLINITRVSIGELPPATTTNIGSVTDERKWNGSLWAMLKYEKGFEIVAENFAIAWRDRVGWGECPSGTLVHFPIPGSELELLGMEIYTFGGVGGEGATP